MNIVVAAFLLTLFAGLSTGVGSAIPFFMKKFRQGYLAFFLGLSAGVMILVSFAELLPKSIEEIKTMWSFVAFFGGMVVVVLIDLLIPHGKNPHHMAREKKDVELIQSVCQNNDESICLDKEEEKEELNPSSNSRVATDVIQTEDSEEQKKKKLSRMGMLTALAIAIHNFPEGIATFASVIANQDITAGISIAVAIAIHNIPEGISVSIPLYYSTKSKWKSFGLSFASGLAEPLGAGIAYLIFMNFLSPAILSGSLAFVAGIMVYISIDELIPVAHEYGKGDLVMGGVVAGMVIMAASLILFQYL
ncbi:MAG: zinc transporter ZupT [Candidatus Thorarchaeota archaeon]